MTFSQMLRKHFNDTHMENSILFSSVQEFAETEA